MLQSTSCTRHPTPHMIQHTGYDMYIHSARLLYAYVHIQLSVYVNVYVYAYADVNVYVLYM